MDIPEWIKKELEALRAEVSGLGKARLPQSVREAQDQRLAQIRHDSMFRGLGEQPKHKHEDGKYPFALYKQTTLKDKAGNLLLDVRGDVLVDRVYAQSDEDFTEKLAQGWLVNPLGVPDEPLVMGKKH